MVGWMMWGAKGAPACVTFKICAFLQMTFQSHRTITNWYHMMEFMHRHQLTGDGRRQRTCRTSWSCRSVIGARCLVLGAFMIVGMAVAGGGEIVGFIFALYCCCCWSIAVSLFAVCRRVRTAMCPRAHRPVSIVLRLLPAVWGWPLCGAETAARSFICQVVRTRFGSRRDILSLTSRMPFRFRSCRCGYKFVVVPPTSPLPNIFPMIKFLRTEDNHLYLFIRTQVLNKSNQLNTILSIENLNIVEIY